MMASVVAIRVSAIPRTSALRLSPDWLLEKKLAQHQDARPFRTALFWTDGPKPIGGNEERSFRIEENGSR